MRGNHKQQRHPSTARAGSAVADAPLHVRCPAGAKRRQRRWQRRHSSARRHAGGLPPRPARARLRPGSGPARSSQAQGRRQRCASAAPRCLWALPGTRACTGPLGPGPRAGRSPLPALTGRSTQWHRATRGMGPRYQICGARRRPRAPLGAWPRCGGRQARQLIVGQAMAGAGQGRLLARRRTSRATVGSGDTGTPWRAGQGASRGEGRPMACLPTRAAGLAPSRALRRARNRRRAPRGLPNDARPEPGRPTKDSEKIRTRKASEKTTVHKQLVPGHPAPTAALTGGLGATVRVESESRVMPVRRGMSKPGRPFGIAQTGPKS